MKLTEIVVALKVTKPSPRSLPNEVVQKYAADWQNDPCFELVPDAPEDGPDKSVWDCRVELKEFEYRTRRWWAWEELLRMADTMEQYGLTAMLEKFVETERRLTVLTDQVDSAVFYGA